MRNFFRFIAVFFGTPRRAIATIGVAAWASVIEQLFPGVLGESVYRMVRAIVGPVFGAVLRVLCEFLGPFIPFILAGLVIALGFRVMFRGFGGR